MAVIRRILQLSAPNLFRFLPPFPLLAHLRSQSVATRRIFTFTSLTGFSRFFPCLLCAFPLYSHFTRSRTFPSSLLTLVAIPLISIFF
jgi:hypothetical protein